MQLKQQKRQGRVFGEIWLVNFGKALPICVRGNPSFHMRLRGLCVKSRIDKYYQPPKNFSAFARLQLVGRTIKSAIEFDKEIKNWKLSMSIW